MSSFSCKEKKSRASPSNGSKCGEVTFCFQVGKRVYALNCLFCPQICLHWDSFITHMEEEHDDLCSDHLMQKEPREAIVNMASERLIDTRKAAKPVDNSEPKNNDPTAGTNYDPPIVTPDGCSFTAYSSIKSESIDIMDEYESPGGSGEKQDRTCSGYEDEVDNNSEYAVLGDEEISILTIRNDIHELSKKIDCSHKLITGLLEEVKLLQLNQLNCQKFIQPKSTSIGLKQPIQSKAEFLSFESYIKSSDENFDKLVAHLKETVSGNSSKFIRNCWRLLIDDSVAKEFCWQGSTTKPALKNFSLTLAVKSAYSTKFADHNDSEFERAVILHFQQAKQRIMNKLNKTLQ